MSLLYVSLFIKIFEREWYLVAMFVRIAIPPGFGGRSWYWFPLSRMLEFSLGIYIVQNGYYIKTINDSILIKFCSDLCFPIFLVHYFLQEIMWKIPDTYNLNIITYVFVTMIVAYIGGSKMGISFVKGFNYSF